MVVVGARGVTELREDIKVGVALGLLFSIEVKVVGWLVGMEHEDCESSSEDERLGVVTREPMPEVAVSALDLPKASPFTPFNVSSAA